jgi:hypothetical protein
MKVSPAHSSPADDRLMDKCRLDALVHPFKFGRR